MKLEKYFDKFVKILTLMIFLWIIILLVFFENKIDYSGNRNFLINNIMMVIIGVAILFLMNKKIKININKLNYDRIVKWMIIILFLMQLYIFYHAYFETGWDPEVLMANARNLAYSSKHEPINGFNYIYYSSYPNNILYTLIASLILKVNSFFGIFINDYDLMSIVFVNCIISSISSYLVYKVGKQLFNKKIAFIGYLISVILFVLSPWNIICYSDSFSIFIPILILYIYMSKKMKYYYKYPLILLLGYMGFSIKPHTLIIVIAIIIVEIIKNITKLNIKKIKKIGITSLISIVSIIILNFSLNKIYNRSGFIINPEAKLGYTHFLMMGVNNENNGVYYENDVNFSRSQTTNKIRNKQNLIVFKKRIKRYGVKNYVHLLEKKLLTLYNDGSFAWLCEGNFLKYKKSETTGISKYIRNIYYGSNYKYYSTFLQFVWINVLVIIFINAIILVFKKTKKIDYTYLVIVLTIIGLTMFELLFEVRARYIYANVPIYIIAMMYGIDNINKVNFRNEEKKYDKTGKKFC